MNNELLKLFDIKDDVVETFTVDHKESNYEIDIRLSHLDFHALHAAALISLVKAIRKDLLYLYLLMINL